MKVTIPSIALASCLLTARSSQAALNWVQASTTMGASAISSNGMETWVLGLPDYNSDGKRVYKYNSTTQAFDALPVGAIAVAAPIDLTGWLYGLTKTAIPGQGQVKRFDGTGWVNPTGGTICATSLANDDVLVDHTLWVVGCDAPVDGAGNRAMYKNAGGSSGWILVNPGGANGYGTQITMFEHKLPAVINGYGYVYKGPLDYFKELPVWSYAGPGGGVYLHGQLLLGWDNHVYRRSHYPEPEEWVDLGGGPAGALVAISGAGSNIWALDTASVIWKTSP